VEGGRELYEYCAERNIAHENCGKVIVATDASELGRLEELERRGKANGVPGLRRIDAAGIEQIEPHARGIAGLHSPSTGIVDFPAVARSYAQDVLEAGGAVATGCEVKDVKIKQRSVLLAHTRGNPRGRQRDLLRRGLGGSAGGDGGRERGPADRSLPRRLSAAGARAQVSRALAHLPRSRSVPAVSRVHLTKHIDGEVLVGPTALLAGARDA